MRLQIEVTDVKGYSYTGWLGEEGGVLIEGDFHLEWDDDIPMPQVENAGIVVDNVFIPLELFDSDLDHISQQISKWECSEWYEDRSALLADMAEAYLDLER